MMKKSAECLKTLVPVAALLIITPLVSTSSLRSKYLYLVVNILIIAVGAEAGLLAFFLRSPAEQDKKPPTTTTHVSSHDDQVNYSPVNNHDYKEDYILSDDNAADHHYKPSVENGLSDEEINAVGVMEQRSSKPSIFFIGDQDHDNYNNQGDQEVSDDDDDDVMSGQDDLLYQKAETFIGDFYKQLKMQRQHSYSNKLTHHHFSHNNYKSIIIT